MRILVCDDHPIVRKGLREILEQEDAPVTVAEAASAQEALELARKKAWDTVVLDITMPGRTGPELLKDLKRERPNVPPLVPNAHPAHQYPIRAVRPPPSGNLTKWRPPRAHLTAVR